MLNMEIPQKAKFILYAFFAFLIIAFIVFNSNGLLKFFSLKSQITQIEEQIKEVDVKLDSLNNEIDLLKNSDKKIEQVAREKYNMHKKNETPIRIEKVTQEENSD